MRCRLLVTALAATTLLASACSDDKSTTATTTPETTSATTTAPAPAAAPPVPAPETTTPAGPTLEGDECVELTGANLDLAVAGNAESAREAADIFYKYNPPADVRAAIEYFVGTGGPQYDDPEYERYNTTIDTWVKQVCPL